MNDEQIKSRTKAYKAVLNVALPKGKQTTKLWTYQGWVPANDGRLTSRLKVGSFEINVALVPERDGKSRVSTYLATSVRNEVTELVSSFLVSKKDLANPSALGQKIRGKLLAQVTKTSVDLQKTLLRI